MESFARRGITPTLLGVRYYDSICPKDCTSLLSDFSLRDSCPFRFALQLWFSCSLVEPELSSCRLNAACHVCAKSGFAIHLYLAGPPTLWFGHGKSYFRHFNDGSLTFNSLIHTITSFPTRGIQSLTLSLSTAPWRWSTTRRFDKYACTSLPIDHSSIFVLSSRPVCSLDLRWILK